MRAIIRRLATIVGSAVLALSLVFGATACDDGDLEDPVEQEIQDDIQREEQIEDELEQEVEDEIDDDI